MKYEAMKIELPESVRYILNKLGAAGYEAYAVGGCVRDSLLGRTPEDWDITTSALPAEIKAVFRKTVDTGIEHGTVTVLIREAEASGAVAMPDRREVLARVYRGEMADTDAQQEKTGAEQSDADGAVHAAKTAGKPESYVLKGYEVTTYRIDGEYRDGRHPQAVSFTPSLSEDLRRRDFTINAMAYNEANGLVDLFGGKDDLSRGIIRCVGDAGERFTEDALRILRAVRFSAQLDFEIEEETRAAIGVHAKNLKHVSKERIFAEISKLLCAAHPERIAAVFALGMAEEISETFAKAEPRYLCEMRTAAEGISDADAALEQTISEALCLHAAKTERAAMEAEHRASHLAADLREAAPLPRKYLRYALFAHGLKGEDVRRLLRELKADNDTTKHAAMLAEQSLRYIPADRYQIKKVMQTMTPELFFDLLLVKRACRTTELYRTMCYGEDLEAVGALFADILRRDEPVYMKDLVVKGADLIRAGMQAGPHMGAILEEMLEDVLREPVHNSILYLLSQHVR